MKELSPRMRLSAMISLLRNLPADFEWDYMKWECCGMGLAVRFLGVDVPALGVGGTPNPAGMANALGIADDDAFEIFCNGNRINQAAKDTTPEWVADQLEILYRASAQ